MSELHSSSPQAQQSPKQHLYGEELRNLRQLNQDSWRELFPTGHEPWVEGELYVRAVDRRADWEREKLEEQGHSHHPVLATEIDQIYDNNAKNYLDSARSDLKGKGAEFTDDMDDPTFATWVVERHHGFDSESRAREGELEANKTKFIERIGMAIDHQGLPLTREQLQDRLAGVHLGFEDHANNPPTSAAYVPVQNRVCATPADTKEELEHDVFHELLHVLSGARYLRNENVRGGLDHRRIGLQQPNRSRLWLNEAVTDLLAEILLDEKGGKYNFGDEKRGLWDERGKAAIHNVARRKLELYGPSPYAEYKEAAIRTTRNVPARTLLRAYFAQDHDDFETDQLAGIHAERDLQRAIKVSGGVDRIKQLRYMDKLFSDKDDAKTDKAKRIAQEIEKEDMKLNGQPVKSEWRRHKVRQHTKRYRQQIERAKQARDVRFV
jgi:hypothetical protein